ncbi:two domain protein [Bacillus thuringiensis]|uniref:1-phosphatidylinositol phosphodiesterase n=1 Tax=Bacillus thuringiensis TaxID=1428 RepID=A0ABD6RV61_BACTU|nr:phosphatidylinositol-specific phospholipase C domain-containing protein [Bacillus thuringiensis]PER38810.1 two domain protein [Bacillus thuringiensis]PEU74816.1 two domain protein [Bacillus thuringiensis]PFI05049.1 two domain protein [Bacillus thuringiensis]PFW51693.1 two domain protein [Bacillus thuringiensis]PGY63982.1 two domain protein [Bacillus thuringiensis]
MGIYNNKTSCIDSPSIRSSYPSYVDRNGTLTMDRHGFNVQPIASYINRDWMNYIPDSRRISELSIPGTHGSMALYGGIGGHITVNQTMKLQNQLNSGIRYFDIRCRHYYNNFPIHHELVYQNAYFGPDVLDRMINFLIQNPSETILMRVKEEYNPTGNTRTFAETFESFWTPNQRYFWNPNSNNPTLGEVRGRIILLQQFPANRGWFGINWGSLDIQDQYDVANRSQIYAKWEKVRNHFFRAMQNRNQISVNHLSGTGGAGGPTPWFVASGFAYQQNNSLAYQLSSNPSPNWPDNPRYSPTSGPVFYGGTNVLSTRRIRDGRFTHTGIVAADFPGKGLIDGTIALNFPGTLSGDFQIVTALNSSSVLDLNGPNNVTLWSNNQGDHQRWNFTYNQSKKAYAIRSVSNPSLVLAWNVPSTNRNVFATSGPHLDEHYWIVEPFQNGYVFKNKRDTDLVLDVVESGTGLGTNIVVHDRHPSNTTARNQTFFIRPI